MAIKEISSSGRIEAVEKDDGIKISMYFNVLSKDSQPVEHKLTGTLPVGSTQAIARLCDRIPAIVENLRAIERYTECGSRRV
jgi:hypothetical protein